MLKEDIRRGLTLQEVDQEIRLVERERDRKPREMEQEEKAVQKVKKEWEDLKAKVTSMRSEVRHAEGGLKEFDEKINKLTVQSNTVKKNDEYQAIMREINAVRAEKSITEDKLLEYYDRIEKMDATVKEKEKEVRAAEQEHDVKKRAIDGEIGVLNRRVEEMTPKRQGIVEGMDRDFLAAYERIASAKEDGLVLSVAVEGKDEEENGNNSTWYCHACQMEITSQDINLLKLCRNIVYCKSCSRILCLEAESGQEAAK